jgi:hypothetical protein
MPKDTLAEDLIEGVPAIAKFLGLGLRQCRHLVDQRRLPTIRFGGKGKFRARKSVLLEELRRLEAAAMAQRPKAEATAKKSARRK